MVDVRLRPYTVTVWLLLVFMGATSLFVSGYFPVSFSSTKRASLDDLPQTLGESPSVPLNRNLYRSHYKKSVLMVIDAMRVDFLQRNNSMKYVNSFLTNGDACQINIHVQAPTVTLPRIKSLTTGTVPNFIDVVLNFGSNAISVDSIIHQLCLAARKIVFLGDDTWVKLFPDSFTRQLQNEDSLFVNDFHKGDNNITARLTEELKHADWDLLIMHYLGLDHIGHVEGPFSERIPAKLRSMDSVAQMVQQRLMDWRIRLKLPSLFLITGDHGMRDTGGHGGNSPAEVNVPLIVAGARCVNSDVVYEQIDIAPTLSVLLGLPIPESSIGSLIPELLAELSEDEQLYALYYNGRRLMDNLKQQGGVLADQEFVIQFNEACELYQARLIMSNDPKHSSQLTGQFRRIQMLFVSSSREMSQHLATKFVNYDHLSLTVGLVYATLVLLLVVLKSLSIEPQSYRIVITTGTFVAMSSIASLGSFYVCKWHNDSFMLCQAPIWTLPTSILLGIAWFLYQVFSTINFNIKSYVPRPPLFVCFIIFATIVHAASLSSSSFVEEEHQVWYFMGKTLLVALAALDWWHRRAANIQLKVPGMGVDLSTRNLDANTLAIERWFFRNGDGVAWIFVLLAHAFLGRLNQTGDKWLSLPDIGDWLVAKENIWWNSGFAGVALLILVYQCCRFAGALTNILTLTASVLIYYFRTQLGDVVFAGVESSKSTNAVIMFYVNLIEIGCISYIPLLYNVYARSATRADVKSCLGANVVMLSLVGALLHTPHNIMLTGTLLMTSERVNAACDRCFTGSSRIRLFVKVVSHVWMGQMFFFYQGNSNSLASINLNAGYIGVSSFNFGVVAFNLTVNTYHSFFLSFAALLYNVFDPVLGRVVLSNTLNEITTTIFALTALPITVFMYVAVAFRSHLFVWTVFSPKLIYEFFHLGLVGVTLLTAFLVNQLT